MWIDKICRRKSDNLSVNFWCEFNLTVSKTRYGCVAFYQACMSPVGITSTWIMLIVVACLPSSSCALFCGWFPAVFFCRLSQVLLGLWVRSGGGAAVVRGHPGFPMWMRILRRALTILLASWNIAHSSLGRVSTGLCLVSMFFVLCFFSDNKSHLSHRRVWSSH